MLKRMGLFKRSLSAVLSVAILAIACTSGVCIAPKVSAANLITNSTFDSGTSGWGTYKESGGACSLSTSNGRLALNITSVGSVNYAVQVFYDIVPLYKNGVYRLKYDISSTTNRYIEGMLQQNGGTYQAYTWKGLNLTSQMQTIDYTFTMTYDSDIMSKLVFNCGTQGTSIGAHTIYIDNVSLELIDGSQIDYSGIGPYETSIITDQVGYYTEGSKVAVFRDVTNQTSFSVVNSVTKQTVYTGNISDGTYNASAKETDYFGDFSALTTPGSYYITCNGLDSSYTFTISDDAYTGLLDDTVRMLYLQRCGCSVSDSVFSHSACHTGRAKIYGTGTYIDVNGGWHDAGDYGRYVVPGAKTVADMLYAYQTAPELYSDNSGIPESGNGVPDILDEVRYELTWMLKMQASSGGVYHKVTCANFPGYIMPENETGQLIVTPVSTTATGDFCGAMAMAYEFYKNIDSNFANTCLTAAERAWSFLETNANLILVNPSDISTGAYGDSSDSDERYWAAAQLYRATRNSKYLNALNSMSAEKGLDWATVGDYGNIAILTADGIDKNSNVYSNAKRLLISEANTFASNSESSAYGVGITKYNWGSNMTIANAGVVLGVAHSLTNDTRYLDASLANLHYLLGKNPLGVCFVTGYGTVSPQSPHHRPSMAKGRAMKGMLVGGVNSNLEDSAAKAYLADSPPAKCFVDNSESYSTNEICIYWNSPLIYLLSLNEVANSAPVIQQGDINADGAINNADLVLLKRHILGVAPLDSEQILRAELNNDGIINTVDLQILQGKLNG